MADENCRLDPLFCGGTVAAPKPNSYMDGIGWCLENPDTNEQDCLTVEDWMTSIGSGSSPDKLTKLDQLVDGQIGGLGTALENIIDTTRAVPLFEFRDLGGVLAGQMQDTVSKAEQAVITYFNKYKTLPQGKLVKRQNDIYGCPTTLFSSPTTATPTQTPTSTPPPPSPPPPTCSAGFYGTDTSCGGKCNGANAKCECTDDGYESFSEACTCTC